MRVSKTPIVVDVPEAGVYAVDDGKSNESCLRSMLLINAVDAQGGVEQDRRKILAAIE